jgi:hypothetical protein
VKRTLKDENVKMADPDNTAVPTFVVIIKYGHQEAPPTPTLFRSYEYVGPTFFMPITILISSESGLSSLKPEGTKRDFAVLEPHGRNQSQLLFIPMKEPQRSSIERLLQPFRSIGSAAKGPAVLKNMAEMAQGNQF